MGNRIIRLVPIVALVALVTIGCSKSAKKERHLQRANQYYEAQQFDKAEIEYLNVLRLAGPDPAAVQRLGLIYFDRGDMPKSFAYLNEAYKQNTNNVDVRTKIGLIFLAARKYKEARAEALFILSMAPANDDALILLSDSAATTNEVTETQQRLLKMAPLAGARAAYHLALGNLYLRQQDLKSAEASFNRALSLDAKYSAAHLAMGNLSWMREDLKQAEQSFKTAADLSPIKSNRRLKYAEFKLRTGGVEDAKRILKEVTDKAPEYVPAWVFLAEIAFAERKFEDCSALIQKVLIRDGNNYEGLLLRGRLKLAQNEPAQAVEEFEKMENVYPRVPQVHYELAVAHRRNNDRLKAQTSLAQSLAIDPNYIDATLLSAQLSLEGGDITSAITSLNALLKKQDKVSRAYLLLADAYRLRGSPEEALGAYQRLAKAFPRDPESPVMAGLLLRRLNKNAGARGEFEESQRRSPDFLPALEQLVELDIVDKQFQNALRRVKQQMEKYPQAPAPQFLLARVHLAQRNTAQAEAVLMKIIEQSPDYRPAYIALSQMYMSDKKPQQALEKLQSIVARRTNDVAAMMQIGMVYEQMKDFLKARETYEKVLSLNAQFTPAMNNLAYLYSEKFNQPDKAFTLAGKAREMLPNDPYTADTLGWILFKKGDYGRAAGLIQESAVKLAEEPEVQYHLGMAQYMLGDEPAARAAFQRAVKAAKDFPGKDEAKSRLVLLETDTSTNSQQTIADLEKRLINLPGDPIVLTRLAGAYERAGALDKAQAAYEKMVKTNPKAVTNLVQMAQAYEKSGAMAKAEDVYQKITKENPKATLAGIQLGRLYERRGELPKAQATYEQILKNNPKDASSMSELARFYAERGNNPAKAMELAKNARSLSPDDPQLAFTLGKLAYQSGDFRWAQSLLSDSARRLPNQPDISYFLALANYGLGRVPEAQNIMQTVAQAGASSGHLDEARLFVAMVSFTANPALAQQAAAQVQGALNSNPDYTPALMALALINEQQAKPAAAQQIYEKILAKNPPFTPAARNLAILYSQNPADATKGYDLALRAREANPDDPELAKALGLMVYRRGDFNYASRLLLETARRRTNDAEIFFYLGLAQNQLKQKKESADSLRKALALNPNAAYATEARNVLNTLK